MEIAVDFPAPSGPSTASNQGLVTHDGTWSFEAVGLNIHVIGRGSVYTVGSARVCRGRQPLRPFSRKSPMANTMSQSM
jgi:hypothetical protein